MLEYYEHGELENSHKVLDIDSPRKGHITINKIGDTWHMGVTYEKQETEEKGGIRKPVETYIPEFTGTSVIKIHGRTVIENDNNVIAGRILGNGGEIFSVPDVNEEADREQLIEENDYVYLIRIRK